mgnify:CR=1 FL=1
MDSRFLQPEAADDHNYHIKPCLWTTRHLKPFQVLFYVLVCVGFYPTCLGAALSGGPVARSLPSSLDCNLSLGSLATGK